MALYMVVTLVSGLVSVSKSSMENLSYLHFPVWGYFAGTVQSLLLAFSTLANYYTACKTMSGEAFVLIWHPAPANLWHACPKWHARRFCVARAIALRKNKYVLILVVGNH